MDGLTKNPFDKFKSVIKTVINDHNERANFKKSADTSKPKRVRKPADPSKPKRVRKQQPKTSTTAVAPASSNTSNVKPASKRRQFVSHAKQIGLLPNFGSFLNYPSWPTKIKAFGDDSKSKAKVGGAEAVYGDDDDGGTSDVGSLRGDSEGRTVDFSDFQSSRAVTDDEFDDEAGVTPRSNAKINAKHDAKHENKNDEIEHRFEAKQAAFSAYKIEHSEEYNKADRSNGMKAFYAKFEKEYNEYLNRRNKNDEEAENDKNKEEKSKAKRDSADEWDNLNFSSVFGSPKTGKAPEVRALDFSPIDKTSPKRDSPRAPSSTSQKKRLPEREDNLEVEKPAEKPSPTEKKASTPDRQPPASTEKKAAEKPPASAEKKAAEKPPASVEPAEPAVDIPDPMLRDQLEGVDYVKKSESFATGRGAILKNEGITLFKREEGKQWEFYIGDKNVNSNLAKKAFGVTTLSAYPKTNVSVKNQKTKFEYMLVRMPAGFKAGDLKDPKPQSKSPPQPQGRMDQIMTPVRNAASRAYSAIRSQLPG